MDEISLIKYIPYTSEEDATSEIEEMIKNEGFEEFKPGFALERLLDKAPSGHSFSFYTKNGAFIYCQTVHQEISASPKDIGEQKFYEIFGKDENFEAAVRKHNKGWDYECNASLGEISCTSNEVLNRLLENAKAKGWQECNESIDSLMAENIEEQKNCF